MRGRKPVAVPPRAPKSTDPFGSVLFLLGEVHAMATVRSIRILYKNTALCGAAFFYVQNGRNDREYGGKFLFIFGGRTEDFC